MCLSKVSRVASVLTGYKLMFPTDSGNLIGAYHTSTRGALGQQSTSGYALNQWYSAVVGTNMRGTIQDNLGNEYPYGFHVIPKPRAALKYWNAASIYTNVLVRVSYRGVLAHGKDIDGVPCVIAAQMKCEEVIQFDKVIDYLENLIPKPKRKTITVAEFTNVFNNSRTLSAFEEKMNELLGYNFLQEEAIKRQCQYKR